MDSQLYLKIQEDIKTAMKEKHELQLSVLRMLASDIKNKKIEKQSDLSEPDVIAVIKKAAKSRVDAIELYIKGGRQDLADKETEELHILESYLPEELSEDETRDLVLSVIADLKASGADFSNPMRQMGNVMKEVTARSTKPLNTGLASSLVKKELGS